MQALLAIALKSVLISGLTLALLALFKRRSSAERSWVAHIGLLALVTLAFAPLVLPNWSVEAPVLFARTADAPPARVAVAPQPAVAATTAPQPAQAAAPTISSAALATVAYAIPAAILLFITLLALGRLLALRARADVLVDGHWLSALAREAHQLREETADDAVLASNIADTDYAELLVGVARHECSGLLLGAHGVAPSRSSLARRVARVLDSASARGPVARPFALGVFVGAVIIAAPLAALTLTPSNTAKSSGGHAAKAADGRAIDTSVPYYEGSDGPADLPHIIAEGVSTSVAGAVAAINPHVVVGQNGSDFESVGPNGASVRSVNGTTVATAPSGATVTVFPPDAHGRRKVVARGPNGATTVSYADADDDIAGAVSAPFHRGDNAIQNAIAMKAVGMTPEYMAAMRASAPELRDADADDLVGMKAVGATPAYVHDLSAAGLRDFDAGDVAGARAVGVDGSYIREMRAAGFGDADLSDLTGARAVGVTGEYVRQMRLAGYDGELDDFVALRAMKDGHRPRPPLPPLPPAPPRPPGG